MDRIETLLELETIKRSLDNSYQILTWKIDRLMQKLWEEEEKAKEGAADGC